MTPHNDTASFLPLAVVLLGAAVLSVPLARKLKLSAIMAYLVAGMLVGPYGCVSSAIRRRSSPSPSSAS